MWDYFLCLILLTASVLSQQQQQQQFQTISNQPINNGNSQGTISNQPINNGNSQGTGSNQPIKDGTPYQVTENTVDRPDDRTLAPIDPTYGINVPLNLGNNSNINNNGYSENEDKDDNDTTEKIKLKKNTFSYVQIQGEFDDQIQIPNFLPNYNTQGHLSDSAQNNVGFKRFLDGIKSYIFSMKKGLVDGLHNWYNKNGINGQVGKEVDKFYRSFHEDTEPDFEGSGEIGNWLSREDVQKEILAIYKSLNEESSEDIEAGDDKNSGDEYEDYSDDYGHHPHFHHHHHNHKGHDNK